MMAQTCCHVGHVNSEKAMFKKICFLADCRMRWVLCFSLTLGLRVSLRDGDPRLQHRMRRGLRLKFLGWSSAAASFMITTAPLKGAQTVPGQTHEFPTCCTRPLAKTEPLWESFLTTSRCFYLLHCILLSWKVACWRLGKTMETRLWGTCCPGIPSLRSIRLRRERTTRGLHYSSTLKDYMSVISYSLLIPVKRSTVIYSF